MIGLIKRILAHPLTRGLSLDDPRTTALRRRIIQEKGFLRRLYEEWYAMLIAELPDEPGPVLEVGSGAGFFQHAYPSALRSEVFVVPEIDVVFDAQRMPVAQDSLRAIVMVDVLHHIPDPRRFFLEAARCVRIGGRVLLIEPWHTPWSSLVYRNLHHEPFEPAAGWTLERGGPLSMSNQALPWIMLERDRDRFHREHGAWRLLTVRPFMPFTYLVSGGVGMRSLIPGFTFPLVRAIERLVPVIERKMGMFAFIVLEKREGNTP